MKISKGFKLLGRYLKHNTPSILTGLGVAGVISTVVLAVKATPKAYDHIRYIEAEASIENGTEMEMLWTEKVKETWKFYVPTAIMGATTIGCIIGANSINLRRQAVLASAYSLAEVTMKEYQAKVVETIGEKKEREIHDKIMEDRIKDNPRVDSQVIVVSGGETDFYDSYSGRYFKHEIEKIRKAVNEFNRNMIHDGWTSINELYSLWGLPAIKGGENVGWDADKLVEITLSAIMDPKTERPCLAIDYLNGPKEDTFRRYSNR
jgi:hypothetical protein